MVSIAGTGGVAVNGALSGNVINNTVLTEIDGSTVHTAGGADTVETFNPAGTVSTANDTIDLGAGHGLQTGDAVVYDSGAGTVIGGLTDGATYFIIEVAGDANKVKLAASAADAYDGAAIDLQAGATGAAHSLTRENNSVFLNARSRRGSPP